MLKNEDYLEREGVKIHYWLAEKKDAPLVVLTYPATIDDHEWIICSGLG